MKNDYKFGRCYHKYVLSNYKYFFYLGLGLGLVLELVLLWRRGYAIGTPSYLLKTSHYTTDKNNRCVLGQISNK